ncbi:5-methylcytosine rRNA methyltransferase NSUN4 [Danaus plexippus]|uniref:5-methylcytosine rRNA methyltransferase NSUN4 n=1 Tax=Danaus plexippus TaxID=13037 RepID=UPI002AB03AB7|nr:5-methylcytosine rRNA methyltransferase NSUN4 [Danaus plexippus]
MFSFCNSIKSSQLNTYLVLQARSKSKTHWAKLKKKTGPKHKAMNHFDEFYGSVFGDKWEPMREALQRRSKYVAVVNNYGDAEETMQYLASRGAHCLKTLMNVQQDFNNQYLPQEPVEINNENKGNFQNYINQLQSDEIAKIYPQGEITPERLEITEEKILNSSNEELITDKELNTSSNLNEAIDQAEIDESRLILPTMGLSSDALYQYVPATKIKGLDEWVPESLHYSFYNNNNTDFPLLIEPETEFVFPEHLKVMTYEKDSEAYKFPEPKRCKTGVFNYYPLDCGSVVSVLALLLRAGDRVLELCAAPGGKALTTLQTLLPDVLVANDASISRSNRLVRVFRDYLLDYETNSSWSERVRVVRTDGRNYTDDQGFDKVLVDVPCTTDRHSVMEDDNNIFRPDRVKERLRIPELQSQLLVNALRLVKPGGAAVYSTCSLSPVQNDGVIHAALTQAFRNHGIIAAVKDLSLPFRALNSTLCLGEGSVKPKYGQLIIPDISANFGPTYVSRLVRLK